MSLKLLSPVPLICILLTRTITKRPVAWVGSVQLEYAVPLGKWYFRNFKPEFLLNWKRRDFWSSKANWRLRSSLPLLSLADLLWNRSLLQRVQKVMAKTIFVLCPPTPQSGRVKLVSFMSQSLRSRAKTAKKCAKQREARGKLLFCWQTANINLLLLFAVLIVVAVVVANEKYGYDNTLCSFLEIIWKTSLAKKELLNPVVRIF